MADATPPARDPALITVPQLRKLHAMFGGRGIEGDDAKYGWLATHLGRDVTSYDDVTKEEASFLFDLLKQPAEPELVLDGDGKPF